MRKSIARTGQAKTIQNIFTTLAQNADRKVKVEYVSPDQTASCCFTTNTIHIPRPRAGLSPEEYMILLGYQRHEELHVRYSSDVCFGFPRSLHPLYNIFEDVRINHRGALQWADYASLVARVWKSIVTNKLLPKQDTLADDKIGSAVNYALLKLNNLQSHGLNPLVHDEDIRSKVDTFLETAVVKELRKKRAKEVDAWKAAKAFYDAMCEWFSIPDAPENGHAQPPTQSTDDEHDNSTDNFDDDGSDNGTDRGSDGVGGDSGTTTQDAHEEGDRSPDDTQGVGSEGEADGDDEGTNGSDSEDGNDERSGSSSDQGTDGDADGRSGDGVPPESNDTRSDSHSEGGRGHAGSGNDDNLSPEDILDEIAAQEKTSDLMSDAVNDLSMDMEDYASLDTGDEDFINSYANRPKVMDKPRREVSRKRDPLRAQAESIARTAVQSQRVAIKRALLSQAAARYVSEREDGHLDTRRKLPAIAAGESMNIYQEKKAGKATRSAVYFCLDISGSMDWPVRDSLSCAAEACRDARKHDQNYRDKIFDTTEKEQLKILRSIYPQETDESLRRKISNLEANLISPYDLVGKLPNRLELASEFVLFMTQELAKYRGETGINIFDTLTTVVRPLSRGPLTHTQRNILRRQDTSGSTSMDEAVVWATEELLRSRLDRKVMFIVTDGESFSPNNCLRALTMAKDLGIELYGVSIGEDGLSRYANVMTDRVYVQGLQAMSSELTRLFRKVAS